MVARGSYTIDEQHSKHQEDYFKSISHHPINNAFHRLEFGSHNPHNIHLATPGETLHMAQLGCAKQAVEAFNYLLKGRVLQSNMASMAQYILVPYFLGRMIGTSLVPNLELVYCQLQKRK